MRKIAKGIKKAYIQVSKKETTKVAKKRQEKFTLPENDMCQDKFHCSLLDKILLAGKVYIYTTCICFYSKFNKKSLIGETIFQIPIYEIQLVEKKKYMMTDTALIITTRDQSQYMFTSLIHRNVCYDLIKQTVEWFQKMQPDMDNVLLSSALRQIEKQEQEDQQKKLYQEKQENYNKQLREQIQENRQKSDELMKEIFQDNQWGYSQKKQQKEEQKQDQMANNIFKQSSQQHQQFTSKEQIKKLIKKSKFQQFNEEQIFLSLQSPISQVTEQIYIGNQSIAGYFHDIKDRTNQQKISEASKILKNYGVQHIICCADKQQIFSNQEFNYIQFEIQDSPEFQIIQYFNQAYEILKKIIENQQIMLIHCNAGVSRSSTILISFLMRYYDSNFLDCFNFVRNKRCCINVENFDSQLKEYENVLYMQIQNCKQMIYKQQQKSEIKQNEVQPQNNVKKRPQLMEEEFKQEKSNKDELRSPLKKQKEATHQLDEFNEKMAPLFKQRKARIVTKIYKDHSECQWTEWTFNDITVRELYLLFFSNNEFQFEDKTYQNFIYFYGTEYLKDKDFNISEIMDPEPEYYSNLYSGNKLQLLDYVDFSCREVKFVHPINKNKQNSKTCNSCIKEKLYWVSPDEFLMERRLRISGLPIACDSFEPIIINHIQKKGDNVEFKVGFYIHFLKSTFLKSFILKGAKKEYEESTKEMKSVFMNVSDRYRQKRDSNKPLLKSQENEMNFSKLQEDRYEDIINQFEHIEQPMDEEIHEQKIDQVMKDNAEDMGKVIKTQCSIF